jgi:hypothetical protein
LNPSVNPKASSVWSPSIEPIEEDGGLIDSSRMQPGVLQKFISGGDEYAYGGGIQRFAPGGGFDKLG